METTVIRTKSIISNPEYLLEGNVITFNTAKFYQNCRIVAWYIRHNELDINYTVRSYDGTLNYRNDTPVPVNQTYTIGNHTVYEYIRPKVESDIIYSGYFKPTETVTRIDFINVEYIGFYGRADSSLPYNDNYLQYQTKQINYRNIPTDYLPEYGINYQEVPIDLADLANFRIKVLQCSGNHSVYGNIQSLLNSVDVITTINIAWGDKVVGDLAVVLNAIKDAGRTSFNLGTSLSRTAVTVNGQTIKSGGNIVFDANGDWDASAILN